MKITYSLRSQSSLQQIKAFIAEDSVLRANNFIKHLKKQISTIKEMPFRYRRSDRNDFDHRH